MASIRPDAILAGAVTHNDASSIAACVAVTGLVWDALAMSRPPEPRWWLDRFEMGPLEWVWRRLYRGPSPLRRPALAAA